jgi:hypothetical protein
MSSIIENKIPCDFNQIVEPLYDYGKLYSSNTAYRVYYPCSAVELNHVVEKAHGEKLKIRVRASGHTFNGCTLPNKDELLIRTNDLDWYRFEERGTVTVGAGALVWDIRDLVETQGFQLPVYNGGWAGPTLGGYINAGGFGKGSLSDIHGGLWENVLSITFIDGKGRSHTVERSDKLFKWIFGSYGQLGIVVEAKLKLIAKSPLSLLCYPKGVEGKIPKCQQEDPKDNDKPKSVIESILFWFSILVAPSQEELAWSELSAFCDRHQSIIPSGGWAGPIKDGEPIGYHYNINFVEFNPPLVYPKDEKFIVMGIMSFLDIDSNSSNSSILEIEADFISLAIKNNFKLYLQAENIGRTINYKHYYGDAVFERFQQLKDEFDPLRLINPGTIFPSDS